MEKLVTGVQDLLGRAVLIRTVTYHHVGHLQSITTGGNGVQVACLTDASWVADSGRFGEALRTGELQEVERFPDPIIVNLSAMIDMTEWKHPLPEKSK